MNIKLKDPYVQSHIWTILSAVAITILPSAVIWLCTLLFGIERSGIVSYAVAVSMIVQQCVIFGTRYFQASDVKNNYEFAVYFHVKCFAVASTILGLCLFVIFSGFDIEKKLVILFWCLYIALNYASDVFEGSLQQQGKMFLAGRIAFARVFIAGAGYALLLLFTKDIVLSLAFMPVSGFCVTAIGIFIVRKSIGSIYEKISIISIKNLIQSCLPVFFSAIFMQLIVNGPKYILSALRSDTELVIFTILQLPSWLINMFSFIVFFGPEFTLVSEYYSNGEYSRFVRRILMQIMFIFMITVAVVVFCFFWGIPLLSWSFNTDLHNYKLQFMILMFGGIFSSLNSLLGNVLVIIRMQKFYLVGTAIVTIFMFILSPILISRYGITGASWGNCVFYPILSVYFAIVLFSKVKNEQSKQDK